MKKTLFIISLLIGTNLIAQDSLKQKEIGMMTSNFNNFGMFYKTGNIKNKWRFQTLVFSGNNETTTQEQVREFITFPKEETSRSEYSILCKVGREHCIPITPRFQIFVGADLISRFLYNSETYPKGINDSLYKNDPKITQTYQLGIGGVVGFNYIIANCIVVGAELSPTVLYEHSKTDNKFLTTYSKENNETKRFVYGFTNQSVLLCLSYRF